MKKFVLLMIILLISFTAAAVNSRFIKNQLASEDGWQQFKQKKQTTFRRKTITGFDLYALEISRVVDIRPQKVFDVLVDLDSYGEVLGDNKYLEAEAVITTTDEIIGYQYARLPLIPNRHYLFKFDLQSYQKSLNTSTWSLAWTLLDSDGIYADFVTQKNKENKNPVYINNGAGIWTIKEIAPGKYENSYRLYLDPAGWMPEFLVNSFNVKNLQQLFDRVLMQAQRR